MPTTTRSPKVPRPSLRSRAFTLIELIVTLVIIAVLIAVAAVSYNSVIGHSKDTATGVQLTQLYKTAAGVAALNREPLTLAHFENATAEVTLAAVASSQVTNLAAGHFEVLPAGTPVTHTGQVQVAIVTTEAGAQVTGLAALSRPGHCVLVRGENLGTRISARNGDCTEDAAEQAQTLTAGDSVMPPTPAPTPTSTAPATLAGALYGTGYNYYGQLGDGATTNQTSFTSVATTGALVGKAITQVAAGETHTCALASDNTLACWGRNTYGQLGDATATSRSTPAAISPGALAGKTITRIAAGTNFTCALTSDSTLACWGQNGLGQLGDGTTATRLIPTAVADGALTGKTVTQLTAGQSFTCAVASDSTIGCWGYNGNGQLGNNSTTNKTSPTAVVLGPLVGKTVTQVVAGGSHACALTSDSTLACWGYNGNGQLGTGTTTSKPTPNLVAAGALSGKAVAKLSAGNAHSCALAGDGTLACWGANSYGQLGDGTTTGRTVPTAISAGALAGKTVSQLLTGSFHTCALTSDSTLACWGLNGQGQLGDGTTVNKPAPTLSTLATALGGKTVFTALSGATSQGTFVLAH